MIHKTTGQMWLKTSHASADAIAVTSVDITAGRDLTLQASNGGATLTGGLLVASRDLSGTLGSLTDVADNQPVLVNSVDYKNNRYASGAVNLTVTGAAGINGTTWGAGGALAASASALTIGANGGTLYAGTTLGLTATSGNLSLGKAAIESTGNLTLSAASGSISTTSDAAQGVRTTAGNLSVTAGNGMTNAGEMSAAAGSVTLRASGTVTSSGALYASSTIDIADKNNAATQSFTNSGLLRADGAITAQAASFTNTGGIQGTGGVTLSASALSNSGTLRSGANATFNLSSTLANTGYLLATGTLAVNAGSNALAITNTSPGYIEAGTALSMTGANATFNTQSGTMYGGTTVDLTLSTLNNSGLIQSDTTSTFAIGGALTNSGTMFAATSISSSSGSFTNTNTGTLQATQGTTLTTTGLLSNAGNLIMSTNAAYSGTINAGTLSNTTGGNIQSAKNLTLNMSGATLGNAADIIAADNLTINSTGSGLTVTNSSGGFIQAGSDAADTLTISGNTVTLNNNSGAYLVGSKLAFTLQDPVTWQTNGKLTNAGTILGGAGGVVLTTNIFDNSGTIQSLSNLTLSADHQGTDSKNSGTILAAHNLTVNSSLSGPKLINTGYLQSGTSSGYTLTLGGTWLDNQGAGVIVGDKLAFNLGYLDNAGWIQGYTGASTLAIGQAFNNTSTGTLILASTVSGVTGSGSVTGGSSSNTTISNSGSIKSYGAATFNVRSINNASTGSVLVNGNLLLDGFAEGISNNGLIQSGGAITIPSPANWPSYVYSYAMTIGATGSLKASSMDAKLRTLTIQDGGLINITNATDLYLNQLIMGGANSRLLGSSGNSTGLFNIFYDDDLTSAGSARTLTINGNIASAGDLVFALSSSSNNTVINGGISAGRDLTIKAPNTTDTGATSSWGYTYTNNGAIYAGRDLLLSFMRGTFFTNSSTGTIESSGNTTFYGNNFKNYGDLLAYGNLSISQGGGSSFLNSGASASIVSNNTLTISGINPGTNGSGAILSGTTVNLNGWGTFDNSGGFIYGSLGTISGFTTFNNQASAGTKQTASGLTGYGTSGAGTPVVAGSATVRTATGAASGSAAGAITSSVSSTGAATVSINGLAITLPSNPNGRFLTNPSPTAQYLIESNPLFLNYNYTVSSNVLVEELGIPPDTILRRLGDAAYENYLISNQLLSLTHRSMLNGYGGDQNTMVYYLFMGAAAESRQQGFTFGKPLTSEQQANLKQDVVWMVETVVSGVRVLAPVVYLSAATKAAVQNGNIGFDNLAMDVGTLNNKGGTIAVNEVLLVNTTGDINNTGGRISGNDVVLSSKDGAINNLGGTLRGTNSLDLSSAADLLTAGGKLETKNLALTSTQGKVDLGGVKTNLAKGDPDRLQSLAVSSRADIINKDNTISVDRLSLTSTGGKLVNERGTLEGADSLTLQARGNIENLSGTIRGGNVSLTSETGSIINKTLTSESRPTGLKGLAQTFTQLATTGSANLSSTNIDQRASIEATGSLAMDAAKNITVTGADVKAGGSALLKAGGDVTFNTIVDKQTTLSFSDKGKTSTVTTTERNIGSTLEVGKDLAIVSGQDITVTGSTVKAGGTAQLVAARDVTFNTAADKVTQVSQTQQGRTKTNTTFESERNVGSSLNVGENLLIDSGRNITVTGSAVKAGGSAQLVAAGDVTFNTAINKDSVESRSQSGRNKTTSTFDAERNVGSSVDVGENLIIDSGKNITLTGAQVSAGKTALLLAENNVTIQSAQDKTSSTEASQRRGVFSSSSSLKTTNSVDNVGSTLKTGENLIVDAGNDLRITGSQVGAGKTAALSAGNDVIIEAARNTSDTTTSSKSKNIFSSSSSTKTVNEVRNVASNVGAGDNLIINSGNDIKVIGSNLDAGGTAVLKATKNITVDTAVDTTNTFESKQSGNWFNRSSSKVATQAAKNVGSNIKTGGDLITMSGGDTTIAGSKIDTGGDLFAQAGGNFNVLARQDTISTQSESKASGFGVAGGLFGKTSTVSDEFKGTNAGSDIKVGGNLIVKSGNDITLQGSNIEAKGKGYLDAKGNINVLDGFDEERSKSRTETETVFSVGTQSRTESKSKAKVEKTGSSGAVSASAQAQAENRSQVNLYQKTVTESESASRTSVASNLKTGDDLTLRAGGDVTVRGSNLETAGNALIDATNVNILAGISTSSSKTKTTSTSIGAFVDSVASGSASAEAGGKAMGLNAGASASAKGSADASVTLGWREETTTSDKQSLKNTGSTIKSGGDTIILAKETATFQGSSVAAGGSIGIRATDITNLVATDIETERTTLQRETAGAYVAAGVGAEASAKAQVGITGVGAGAEAKVRVNASVGGRYSKQDETTDSGSITNQTNSFTAGGDIIRIADGTIRDQGTQLDAGGDIRQSATRLIEDEISDSQWSNTTKFNQDTRVGAYVAAQGSVAVGGQAGAARVESKDKAPQNTKQKNLNGRQGALFVEKPAQGGGLSVSNNISTTKESSSESTAVTSSYKAGGSIQSVTTEDTRLIGTRMQAGGDIDISAKTLDFKAARDTTSQTFNEVKSDVTVEADIAGKTGNLRGGASGQKGTANSTTARVGELTSTGGAIRVNTTGNATFEGTQLDAAKNVDVTSKNGSVIFNAAKSTENSTSIGGGGSVDLMIGKKEQHASGGGSFNKGETGSVKNTVATIKSGTGSVNVTAGKDIKLEGTKLSAKEGSVALDAGETVSLLEAKDTQRATGFGVSAQIGMSQLAKKKGKDQGANNQSGGIDVTVRDLDVQQGNVVTIEGKSSNRITANRLENQEAKLDRNSTGIYTQQGETTIARTNVNKDIDVGISAEFSNTQTKKPKAPKPGKKQSALKPYEKDRVSVSLTDSAEAGKEIDYTKLPDKPQTPVVPTAVRVIPPVVVTLPQAAPGMTVQTQTKDGKPLPSWMKFDPVTGILSGVPPADFQGKVEVVIKVPQADGTIQEVQTTFGGGN